MRYNKFLDNPALEDDEIGELKEDKNGKFRIVNGKKVYQIEEKTQSDKDLNLVINRVRASGLKAYEYLKRRRLNN